MKEYIESIIGSTRPRILVFDGPEREMEKKFRAGPNIKAFSRAVRLVYSGNGNASSLVSRSCKPSYQLVDELMGVLSRDFSVYQAKGEADFLISAILKQYPGSGVVSRDSDYLVFSDASFLISPVVKYRSVTFKADVLKKFGK